MNQKNTRSLKTKKSKGYACLFCIPLILIFGINKAQNLVPNHSFENFDTCPIGYGEIYKAIPWHSASLFGSPDYFNSCSPGANVPYAAMGYQYVKVGNAFAGEYGSVLNLPPGYSDIREYLQTELDNTLYACGWCSFHQSLCEEAASIKKQPLFILKKIFLKIPS